LDNIEDEPALERFSSELADRFGPLPRSVVDLIKTVRLRWVAQRLGFEKVSIKDKNFRGNFVPPDRQQYFQSAVFGQVISFIQTQPNKAKLKEINKKLILTIDGVGGLDNVLSLLKEMAGQSKTKVTLASNPILN
jgi:transcription-repair coupling factor (superfamily II helicase)